MAEKKNEYEKLVEKYKTLALNNPITATMYGIHDRDRELPRLSKGYFADEIRRAKELRREADAFDGESLDFDRRVDLDLMKLNLDRIVFLDELAYNGLADYEQKPNAGSMIIDSILYLFLKDPRECGIRIEGIVSRIEQIPPFLEHYKKLLKKVVSRWKDIEAEELKGVKELFTSVTDWTSAEAPGVLSRMKDAVEKAEEAIGDYLRFLSSLDKVETFAIGEEKTRHLVKLNGIDLSLEEIFEIAKDFFVRFAPQIAALSGEIREKYDLPPEMSEREVLDFIKERFALPLEGIVPQYKEDQEKVLEFLRKSDYFVLPPSDRLIIMKTPPYLVPTIPTGAMLPPAPFEEGPKTSIVYITLDEARRKDQNRLTVLNTMIHEGIPGHHLQFAIAYQNESAVRKLADYHTHAEGWTTYLEGFMNDIGFIPEEIRPEYLLVALMDFSRLGARVAIDLYFMTGEEKYLSVVEGFTPEGSGPFEKASSLLRKTTGFTEARAEGELNWYSKERGYPMCYLIGNRIVWEMQKAALAKSPDKEEALRRFHKTYLQEGVMPLGMLRRIMEEKGQL